MKQKLTASTPKRTNQPWGVRLEQCRLLAQICGFAADASDFRSAPCAPHFGNALASDDECRGVEGRRNFFAGRGNLVVAWRKAGRSLQTRVRLSGERGFVDLESIAAHQHGIRLDPTSLRDEHQIARHKLSSGNGSNLPLADHLSPRLRESVERAQRALGARSLHDDQSERKQRSPCEEQTFGQIPDEKIKRRGSGQEQEHRFAQRLAEDFANRA